MLETNIPVKTDQFDGPLGLLLMLIQKDEINIKDIDITQITQQYLDYLAKMKSLNFDIVGDYLYLAATLLYLKSKSCLGEEEQRTLLEEIGDDGLKITSKAELIQRLEELSKFQQLAQGLANLPRKNRDIFVKPKVNRKELINSVLTPIDLEKITLAMISLLERDKRKNFMVARERLSLKEKLLFLKEALKLDQKYTLETLLNSENKNDDLVITFICLLELARLKKISIFQNEYKGDIYVEAKEDLENFNVELANGFEDEDDVDPTEENEQLELPVSELKEIEVGEIAMPISPVIQ